jgi:hypothetical protein
VWQGWLDDGRISVELECVAGMVRQWTNLCRGGECVAGMVRRWTNLWRARDRRVCGRDGYTMDESLKVECVAGMDSRSTNLCKSWSVWQGWLDDGRISVELECVAGMVRRWANLCRVGVCGRDG